MATNEREIPQNIEAEIAILGSVLIDPLAIIAIAEMMAPEDFYRDAHRIIYTAMLALVQSSQPADLVTVSDVIDQEGKLEAIGGADYLTQLATAVLTSGHLLHYVQIVKRCSQARKLIALAGDLAGMAYGGRVDEAVAMTVQRLARIEATAPVGRTRSYRQWLEATRADVERRRDGNVPMILTGFAKIDRWLGGFEPGQLILIAGRPGSGKSALGLAQARRMAGRFQHIGQGAIDIVTMEMSAIAQARRLLSLRADGTFTTGVMRQGFRQGDQFDVMGWHRFLKAYEQEAHEAGDALHIREDVVTTEQLNLHVLRAKQERDLRVLVVDQLNLLADEHRDETQRIGRISAALKRIAMRYEIVVICLTQLNREVEKRADHRPQLADLRQSGELEQNADIVMGLYRPAYYYPPEEHDPAEYAEYAELIGLKARDEEANIMLPLRFIPSSAAFDDWSYGDIDELVAAKERSEGRKSA